MDLDFESGGFLTRVYNHLHHRFSARADAVVATTQDTLRLLGDSCRGVAIPLGVDLEHFGTNGQKDAQFTVLFIGQFRPYKGVRVLLQAMSQVTGARLLLAGQGPEEQAYRSLGAEIGLDVAFHIGVDDGHLLQLYQRAHAIVLPSVSRREAFGVVLVEGMAAGCVPIASDLPGVREVVGRTGFLFPTGDANRLAGILRVLRDDPALVQKIGDRARVRAAGFSRERAIREYDRLITGLVASRDLTTSAVTRVPPATQRTRSARS
jgi:rhamnosyl/mannosyltransferase